ncbi:FAD-dependent monooxygenase [Kribbella sp. NPDC059898]|uniref:FAD-dependent monooxygenase n=1 Tax=Kribbella sp. NPDC059898 TaxID=3346995 RepID=UPI003668C653
MFGDSIADLHDDGEGVDVTFDSGMRHRFDLVIGADGLHSNVRRLAFGSEEELQRPLGGYLAVFSMPDVFGLGNHTLAHFSVGKLVGVYGVRQTGQVRAGFLFRGELTYDHRDKDQQKAQLVKEFGDYGWKVPQLLEHLENAEDFYFDSIAQITLDSWVAGRVALVGDAGYSPGPAVGGGTSLAVVAAYVLAGELAAAGPAGLRNYEQVIRPLVDSSRRLSPKIMGTVIPSNALAVRLRPGAAATLAKLPTSLQRLIWSQNAVGKVFSSTTLPDYSDLLKPERGQPVP